MMARLSGLHSDIWRLQRLCISYRWGAGQMAQNGSGIPGSLENSHLKIQEFPVCGGSLCRNQISAKKCHPVSPFLPNSPFVEVHLCGARNLQEFFTPFPEVPRFHRPRFWRFHCSYNR